MAANRIAARGVLWYIVGIASAFILSCTIQQHLPRNPQGEFVIPTDVPAAAARRTLPKAYIRVDNQNWSYVRVYVSRDGNTPIRLGAVETSNTVVFPWFVEDGARYSFLLHPLGSNEAYTTEAIAITNGDTIRLSIANHLNFTTLYRQPQVQQQ